MKKTFKIGLLFIVIGAVLLWLLLRLGTVSKLLEQTKGRAELSWEIDDSVKGYKVYWGTSPRKADCPSGGYPNQKEVGKVGRYELDGLVGGETYYFSISALGDGGKESCFSPETKKEIPSDWRSLLKKFKN